MFTRHQYYGNHKDSDPVAQWVQKVLEAFVKDEDLPKSPLTEPCLYIDERHNLWFLDSKYIKPSLLAVRTADGVMNIRTSGSDGSRHAKGPYQEWIIRASLKKELQLLCKAANIEHALVAKLTPRKATQAMLVRSIGGDGFGL